MNADRSRRTFLLGGLATGAVLLAGKTFLHPSAAHAATEAVTLDVCVNMTPEEMADRSIRHTLCPRIKSSVNRKA